MKQQRAFKLALAALAAGLVCTGSVHVLAAPSGWLNIDGSIRKTGVGVDWGNPGPTDNYANPVVVPCTPGTVRTVSGTGGLFDGGRCTAANTPPIAPSRTANATGDPTVISSIFLVDPESGDTTACGSGDPTTTGGTNGDAINSYNVAVGPVNNKTDLSNVYAATHTRADGHPEVYFGAERLVNNGEAHVDFEFLQSVSSLAPCATGVGALTGHRAQGDMLVAVDFTNGGSLAGFSVRQWHCAADPGPQPADGTVCDPSGGPEHYELITTTTEVNVTVNAADVPCGGWVCRDATGAPIATVLTNDLMEGGIDLRALNFTGCFNTFLPHTRVSSPFNAQLSDFAGPIALKTCRDPVSSSSPGGTIAPGDPAHDVVTLANGGVAVKPTGTVTFFLCTPAQVTGSGCGTGTQVGTPKALVSGVASSDPTTSTAALGKYCWRTVYTPDAASLGMYTTASHTNATSECFNVAAAVALPNTGVPELPFNPWLGLQAFLIAPAVLLMLAWRRGRSIAIVLIAGTIAGSSPSSPPISPAASGATVAVAAQDAIQSAAEPPHLGGVKARALGWRLLIPRLGVDAQIQVVGKDRNGAMSSPNSLETVGWFNGGPLPGRAGDAVIAGHLGLPSEPAVFSNLRLLRPGDSVQVVWSDGSVAEFTVTTSEQVAASAHPPGVFAKGGAPRLTLITCDGQWDQASRSYTDRLIVTAVPV